jgi:hypothetical protein
MHDNALEIAIFLHNNGQSKGFSRIHVEGDLIDPFISLGIFYTYHLIKFKTVIKSTAMEISVSSNVLDRNDWGGERR